MLPRIITVESAGSTNSLLASMAADSEHGTVVRAVEQTAGRGQRGNSWEAEPGKNLTFSLLLKRPEVDAAEQFIISQMVALGVAETVASLLPGQTVSVKWPNDIYVGDRKICGILIECSLNGRRVSRAICGIGINVNQEVFRSDAPNPVSIRQLTGADTPLEPLLNYVTSRILDLAETPREEWPRIAGAYFDRLYRREGIHPFLEVATGLRFNGHIEAVAPTGHITIADSSTCEQRRYAFKEVVFLHE